MILLDTVLSHAARAQITVYRRTEIDIRVSLVITRAGPRGLRLADVVEQFRRVPNCPIWSHKRRRGQNRVLNTLGRASPVRHRLTILSPKGPLFATGTGDEGRVLRYSGCMAIRGKHHATHQRWYAAVQVSQIRFPQRRP